jgi:hypothetical protein
MAVDKSFQFLVAFGNSLEVLTTAFLFGSELESRAEVMNCRTIFDLFSKDVKLLEKRR